MSGTPSARGLAGLTVGPGLFGLRRAKTDRVVAGAAAGVANRLGLDPVYARAAFIVLAFAGGAGITIYLLAWALLPEADDHAGEAVQTDVWRAAGFAVTLVGVLVALRELGLWFGDALVWPLALAACGSSLIWARGGVGQRLGLPAFASIRSSPVRVVLGALLVVIGMGAVLAANAPVEALANAAFALGVSVAGLALIVGPWGWRLARQVSEERRQRVRSEERAEVAAHLHDSVLQTLALIQRSSAREEMASLARQQERELRVWLYGPSKDSVTVTIETAVSGLAAEVERLHHVAVDVVVVGDAPLDDRARAVVGACGEAMTNAAAHSGAEKVAVYVEVEPDLISAYVSDEGSGFQPERVASDRHGIAESIRGRVERHGGAATVTSTLGEGTEVSIRMPRDGR